MEPLQLVEHGAMKQLQMFSSDPWDMLHKYRVYSPFIDDNLWDHL